MKAVLYPEGRDVKKGDRLYQIDPFPSKPPRPVAKAKIAQAEARLCKPDKIWRG